MYLLHGRFQADGACAPVPISTLYQEMTPADIRGQVFALRGALATSLARYLYLAWHIDRPVWELRVLYGLGWLIMGADYLCSWFLN